jgi:hypothetical protein
LLEADQVTVDRGQVAESPGVARTFHVECGIPSAHICHPSCQRTGMPLRGTLSP